MIRVMLLHAADTEAIYNAMRAGNAQFVDGVEVFDEDLGRNVVRSSTRWGAKEAVVARYETDGTPIDVWSNFFRIINNGGQESVACFAMYEHHIDLFLRPLYNLGLITPLNAVEGELWVEDPKQPCLNISAEDKEIIQRVSNMLPYEDEEGNLIDQMPAVTGV